MTRYENPNDLVKETLLECSKIPDVIMWRQNVGLAYSVDQFERMLAGLDARPVSFGVPGMADLGGIAAPLGMRIEVECKSGSGRPSEKQIKYRRMIEKHGGIYILARTAAQGRADLEGELQRRRAAA